MKNRINIIIINEYAGSAKHGMTYRHYYLAKEWIKKGHQVTIVTGSFSHFLKEQPKINGWFTKEIVDGIEYIWVKVLHYGSAHDKRRVFKWFQFAFKILFIRSKLTNHPDVIICSPTAPFSFFTSYLLAKKLHAKIVFEVRDIWPLTLVELGKYGKKNPFITLMGLFERHAIKKADVVVSNLPNYKEHVEQLGISRQTHYIPNGVVITGEQSPLNKTTSDSLPKNKFVIGYAGTLGHANALEFFIEAMKSLSEYKHICAVIVGQGKNKEALRQTATGYENIVFLPPIDKNEVPGLLEHFDVCYIGLQKKKLFYYGVSPNKLFDYMLSGAPIIHSISTKNDLVEKAQCGISVEAESPQQIAAAILKLYSFSQEERDKMGNNGKEFVKKYHNYSFLAEEYLKLLEFKD